VVDAPFNASEILKTYKRVAHAISAEEGRPVLQCLAIKDNTVQTSNGCLLSVVPTTQDGEFLLPGDLCKNLDLFAGVCKISVDGDRIHISDGNSKLAWSGVSGKFPDVTAIIPKLEKEHESYTVNRLELIDALKYLMKVSDNVVVVFHMGTLMSDDDFGGNPVVVTLAPVSGSDEFGAVKWGFNNTYMTGILNQFNAERVRVNVWNAKSAVLIESIDSTEFCVLMPMFLSESRK
jgi:DNA polymerase III sliding clamp (beta) subunit (PCNA family)